MIEINLSPTKKESSLTNIGGIDLSLINVKMLVFALAFLYIPEIFLEDHFESQIKAEQAKQTALNQEYRSIRSKVASMNNIKKQVDALLDQEKKLAKKLEVVRQVIGRRTNPHKVFKYIADNMPDGVWLTSLELNGKEISFKGYSKNFQKIGDFIDSLKNSIFFQKSVSYVRPDGMNSQVNGVNLEVFLIKAQIASFE